MPPPRPLQLMGDLIIPGTPSNPVEGAEGSVKTFNTL